MINTGILLEEYDYPEKFNALKPKAMAIARIMADRELNFSQAIAWQDTVILLIMLQLTRPPFIVTLQSRCS
jgi:hypothetical protein